jgi:hypothetical protein
VFLWIFLFMIRASLSSGFDRNPTHGIISRSGDMPALGMNFQARTALAWARGRVLTTFFPGPPNRSFR